MSDQVRPPAGARRERASGGGQGVLLLSSAIAIVVSGSRPGLEQGLTPSLVQFAGYGCALVVIMVATIRLALGIAAAGRAR